MGESKKFIEEHIKRVIEEFNFENQKLKNSDKCPCYKEGKCHDIEELNCLLCFCSEYDNSKEEGGCRIGSNKGKWFVKDGVKIWDCSDCDWPHGREVVEGVLRRLWGSE